jgi:hypothetical protein
MGSPCTTNVMNVCRQLTGTLERLVWSLSGIPLIAILVIPDELDIIAGKRPGASGLALHEPSKVRKRQYTAAYCSNITESANAHFLKSKYREGTKQNQNPSLRACNIM